MRACGILQLRWARGQLCDKVFKLFRENVPKEISLLVGVISKRLKDCWQRILCNQQCEQHDGNPVGVRCHDVAVLLTVDSIAGPDALCRDEEGRQELVATELVGDVLPGDRLLVHAGVAIERLAAARAGG